MPDKPPKRKKAKPELRAATKRIVTGCHVCPLSRRDAIRYYDYACRAAQGKTANYENPARNLPEHCPLPLTILPENPF